MGVSSFTLKRHEKIRKSNDFKTIYLKGAKQKSRHFNIAVLPNNLLWSRLGVTVSKKVGKAAQRNYVKRRLREYFRLHKEVLPSSSDIVLTAKPGAHKLSAADIILELNASLLPQHTAEGKGSTETCCF